MERKVVEVSLSPKQASRMRMGHRVRCKRCMQGEGVSLIVNPMNYSAITRAFSKNKGAEVALTPDELVANQETDMEGQGLYMSGGKISRLKKAGRWMGGIEKTYDSIAKRVAPLVKPIVAQLAPALGSAGASYVDPQGEALKDVGKLARMTGTAPRTSNLGGPKAPAPATLDQGVQQEYALGNLNEAYGTNMGYTTASTLGNLAANVLSSALTGDLNGDGYLSRSERVALANQTDLMGQGLYYSGRGLGKRQMRGLVGPVGQPIGVPALRSQPFAVNFHQQFQLPPEYQKFASGSGLYM